MSTALHTLLWLVSLIPRADDPWPDHIGVGFPFAFAGAGSVIGSFMYPDGTSAQRDRISRRLSLLAFGFGWLFYCVALLAQLA